MSYPTHLLCRNGHFYYKIKVPVDLQQHFPFPYIKKSFKTTDLPVAKAMLVTMEYQTKRVFTLLRTGMLKDDMVGSLINEIVPVGAGRVIHRPNIVSERVTIKKHPLSGVIRQYTEVKQVEWTPKTKMEMGGVFRLLQDILGDVDVTGITKQGMLDLRAKLMRLPANLYKRYPGQTILQILDVGGITPMSIKSVNKHVGGMAALLRYCADEGIVPTNHAIGLKMSEKGRVDEERSTYSIGDLKLIVGNLPSDPSTPERYWIPLIGCYSGMRLNEICQLYIEDVLQVDGIWCFSINGAKDKRLKNDPSERMIPVHPKLIDLGLIEYVDNTRKLRVPRVWMNLTWMDVHGYSNGFGKWYQRFNRAYVTEDPKKVFHSFRHLVTDTLKQAGVQDSLIAEMVGHSHGNHSMTMSRYGKRYQPRVLLEAMMHLDYGLDVELNDR